jgi:hypothetical protein
MRGLLGTVDPALKSLGNFKILFFFLRVNRFEIPLEMNYIYFLHKTACAYRLKSSPVLAVCGCVCLRTIFQVNLGAVLSCPRAVPTRKMELSRK